MSTNTCETLRNVKKGRTDWKIKCRVIREWRGISTTGEIFKGWNLLLLDAKNCRMEAYVPATMVDRMLRIVQLGKLYLIVNFEVKDYMDKDKFRPVHMDKKIVFTTETKMKEIADTEVFIPQNTFDFYDFSDLKKMASQYHNLVDVVGVVQDPDRLKIKQSQQGKPFLKFKLSDGSKKIFVTFWNAMAEEFSTAIQNISQEPIILIIASGRVSKWNEEVDICNYSPTKFYLNYEHHSVNHLRKLSKGPNFSQSQFSMKRKTYRQCTLLDVAELGTEYIEDEVICKASINFVDESKGWKITICTSCQKEIQKDNDQYACSTCKRIVPYPNKKFQVYASVTDSTGQCQIVLLDREVRTLLGKNVFKLEKEDGYFPPAIKMLQAQDYTIKILIKRDNIENNSKIYEVNGIFVGWIFKEQILQGTTSNPNTTTSTSTQCGASDHLDNISQLQN